MPSSSNKKLSILYTLQVLRDYSDENHLLSQNDIVIKINNIYGMTCERKSIATNIDSLIDFGYDIVKTNAGSYLASREFEPSEIRFLVDAVFSSKSINSKQSRELAKKLSEFLSVYQRKQYKYVYKTDELNRTDSKELFYNVDIINEAIENNKQIEFDYIRNGYKSNNTKKHPYIVNPYCLINNQGKYFLVCNYDYFDEIGNYKLERIHNIKILDTPIKPVTQVKGFENGLDIAKYANENIYMFATKTINATVKIHREEAANYVEEWFGKNANLYEKENSIFADITANETSLIYWCLQYGEDIELLSPKDTRDKIKEIVKQINKRYK
ncbi:MAG: WYL domain-containing protein [Eubacteriales bacterium]|nr:WYL domain-containing protein [Eubacteriales bacterium]